MQIVLNNGASAQLSAADRDLANVNWQYSNGYAANRISRKDDNRLLYMHRVVLERVLGRNLTRQDIVDHINGEKLDNRRVNLRLVTRAQNRRNQVERASGVSKYVGVARCFHVTHIGWIGRTYVSGSVIHLGCFESEQEAAWMRDQLVIGLFEGFTSTNFQYFPID